MLAHPIFGKNELLDRFLTHREPPPRTRIKSGIGARIRNLAETFEQKGRANHRDCDDFFHHERDWNSTYGHFLRDSNEAFIAKTASNQKLGGVISHLATAFTLGDSSGYNRLALKFSGLFSKCLEDYKSGFDANVLNNEATLGATLESWSRYIEAEREMLDRRTAILVYYEKANRSLDRANPSKRKEAEDTKLNAERLYEETTDTAKGEIKRFHRMRIEKFSAGLVKYGEGQLLVARDVDAILRRAIASLESFTLPPPAPQLHTP